VHSDEVEVVPRISGRERIPSDGRCLFNYCGRLLGKRASELPISSNKKKYVLAVIPVGGAKTGFVSWGEANRSSPVERDKISTRKSAEAEGLNTPAGSAGKGTLRTYRGGD